MKLAEEALDVIKPTVWQRTVERAWDTSIDVVVTYGPRVVGAMIIIFVGYFAARMAKRAMIRTGRRAPHVDMTVVTFIGSLAKYAILAFTLVAVLSTFGVQTTSVVAVIGAAGLAIGLALQGTLGHVASGFMLVLFRPFRVGDTVETAGVTGTVTEVSLFTTEINSVDNVRIVIPNSNVWAAATKNLTTNQTRRCDVDVLVAPDNDIDAVIQIIRDVIAGESRILAQPAPVVGVVRQTEIGIKITSQSWCKTTDLGSVQFGLYQSILRKFRENDVVLMPAVPARTPPAS